MSALYLIRHAQAGPRHLYDTLSDLGRTQARALGRSFAAQNLQFSAAFSGSLERQKATALEVKQAFEEAGRVFPKIREDPLWNEFDLAAVYEALAEPLCRDDPQFEREYKEMVRVMGDLNHAIHRNHSYCDVAVVRAWTQGRYPYDGESWEAFRTRILGRLEPLSDFAPGEKIAVFTSATPIGVCLGHALELNDLAIWRLAGATYNSGVTTFQIRDRQLRLFSFNCLPHLPDPSFWSFR